MMFGQTPRMTLDLIFPNSNIAATNEPFDASNFENLIDLNEVGDDGDWQNFVYPKTMAFCVKQENKFRQMYTIATRTKTHY